MAKKTEPESSEEILEQGDIYFLYRPRVRSAEEAKEGAGEPAAEDLGDVQNFYMVLKPQDGRFRHDGPLGTLGRTIRYRFRLLALDQPLELSPGLDRKAFLASASGHLLEHSELLVTYERGP